MRQLRCDDLTAQALKRLRSDPDFQRVSDWLARSLHEQDEANRVMADSIMLRMGQGAATVLATVVAAFKGEGASKGATPDTRSAITGRTARSDTASRGAS